MVDADWGKEHRYRRKIDLGQEQLAHKTTIVVSTSQSDFLPKSLSKPREGVRELCEIQTVLDSGSLSRKNHKWWNLRKEYNLAEFRVRLLVGSGLKFEILNKDGKCAKVHDEISVEWEPVGEHRASRSWKSEDRAPEFRSG